MKKTILSLIVIMMTIGTTTISAENNKKRHDPPATRPRQEVRSGYHFETAPAPHHEDIHRNDLRHEPLPVAHHRHVPVHQCPPPPPPVRQQHHHSNSTGEDIVAGVVVGAIIGAILASSGR